VTRRLEGVAVAVDREHLGWVLLGLFVAGVFAFVFCSYVGTFVFAVVIYYATRPVYRRVTEYVRPPSLAAGVSLFLLALPVSLFSRLAEPGVLVPLDWQKRVCIRTVLPSARG